MINVSANVILGRNIGSWANSLGESGDNVDRFCKKRILEWC